MPRTRDDLAVVNSFLLFEPGGVRCSVCKREFLTENARRVARKHVRHIHQERLFDLVSDSYDYEDDSDDSLDGKHVFKNVFVLPISILITVNE